MAVPGLVSIPTTHTRSYGSPTPFRVLASVRAVADLVGAFNVDSALARVARLRRSVGASARCLDAAEQTKQETVMLTLTYRGTNADWEPGHIRRFLTTLRAWCSRRGIPCRYVWVAELQKRGTIHYHVAAWVPPGTKFPKPDQEGWWPHGMTRVESARRAVPYLMKYLSKGSGPDGAQLPHGARSHGRGGLGENFRTVLRWLSYPAFIRARASVVDRWVRVRGGGWSDPDGELWPSEFRRVYVGNAWALQRVVDHGRPFEPDGPFSWAR